MKTVAWWWRIRFAYKINLGLILAILSLAIVCTEVRGLKKLSISLKKTRKKEFRQSSIQLDIAL